MPPMDFIFIHGVAVLWGAKGIIGPAGSKPGS